MTSTISHEFVHIAEGCYRFASDSYHLYMYNGSLLLIHNDHGLYYSLYCLEQEGATFVSESEEELDDFIIANYS